MISLGGIVLSDDILQRGIEGEPTVAVKSFDTIKGNTYTVIQQLYDCKSIDIYGENNTGWVSYATYKEILNLALDALATHVLVYNDYTSVVRFRYEDAPVVSYTPLIPRPNITDEDYVYMTIKLKEI
jgi:hypothetical protein